MSVLPPSPFVAELAAPRSADEPATVSSPLLPSVDAVVGSIEESRFVLDEVRFMDDIEGLPAFLAGATQEFMKACERDA
jgi:hypothetical protein